MSTVGVSRTVSGKWLVTIQKLGKSYSGGTFDRKEDAALKYNQMAKEFFGDYARLNIVEGVNG